MLQQLYELTKSCQRCSLSGTRHKIVFGEGNLNPKMVLLGEGPGESEDLEGRPFIGDAGKQLDKILNFIEVPREDIYILNSVMCRPPENRVPLPEELEACRPRLLLQLALLKPKIIVCLGRTAHTSLFGEFKGILKQFFLRNDLYIDLGGHHSIVKTTLHPSALLRNSNFKRESVKHWEEIKELYNNV